jgi:hypothetical protein
MFFTQFNSQDHVLHKSSNLQVLFTPKSEFHLADHSNGKQIMYVSLHYM